MQRTRLVALGGLTVFFLAATSRLMAEEGVLTAFSNCEGKADLHRIHYGKDGKELGTGSVRYEACRRSRASSPTKVGC
jgi:hypothetical protein